MKSAGLLIIALFTLLGAKANMAYMGPKDAHVSGQMPLPRVRIVHELLTADMRKLPAGKINVFADYQLLCAESGGKIRFLFVASSEMPVNPEIILDGQIIKSTPRISDYRPGLSSDATAAQRDSQSQLIGYELLQEEFHYQHLLDQLFEFEVELTEGTHRLKIGYECSPTGYEKGNLRYTSFPYFLGNNKTRGLYDCIFIKILLPEEVEYETNFDVKYDHGTLLSGNIAGFKKSHIMVSIFKNLEPELAAGYNRFLYIQIFIWVILVCTTIWYLNRRKTRKKKLIVSLLWVIPIAILVPTLFIIGEQNYFHHYREMYGPFLEGSFGKGYFLFLVFPIMAIIAFISWLALALIYHYLICGRKWDPMRIFLRGKG